MKHTTSTENRSSQIAMLEQGHTKYSDCGFPNFSKKNKQKLINSCLTLKRVTCTIEKLQFREN